MNANGLFIKLPGWPKNVSVVVNKTGQVFLADKPIELPALGIELKKTAQRNPDTEVQLRADDAVAYGRVVQVIGVAQSAGLNRIGFVADATAPTVPAPTAPGAPSVLPAPPLVAK